MNKQDTIRTASLQLGEKGCRELLTECSINLAAALIQLQHVQHELHPDPDLIDAYSWEIDGRIADVMIAVEMVIEGKREDNVHAEIMKRIVRLDVQNLESTLP